MSVCFSAQLSLTKLHNQSLQKKIESFFLVNNSFLVQVTNKRNEDFIEAVVSGKYIYLSCYIKTKCDFNYFVLYEPEMSNSLCKSKQRAFEEDDYWSDFNRGFMDYSDQRNSYNTFTGLGNALVVLEYETLSIINIYFFKDTYNIDAPVEILDVVDGNVVVRFSEFNYVFESGDYTFFNFVNSYKHKCFGKYWINFPDCGYDQSCGWDLIDISSHKITPLTNIEPNDSLVDNEFDTDVDYDYNSGKFIFKWSKYLTTSFSFKELIGNEI